MVEILLYTLSQIDVCQGRFAVLLVYIQQRSGISMNGDILQLKGERPTADYLG